MDEAAGFEPADLGVKGPCLAAWLCLNIETPKKSPGPETSRGIALRKNTIPPKNPELSESGSVPSDPPPVCLFRRHASVGDFRKLAPRKGQSHEYGFDHFMAAPPFALWFFCFRGDNPNPMEEAAGIEPTLSACA